MLQPFRADLFQRNYRPNDQGAMYALASLCDATRGGNPEYVRRWAAWAGLFDPDAPETVGNHVVIDSLAGEGAPYMSIIAGERGAVICVAPQLLVDSIIDELLNFAGARNIRWDHRFENRTVGNTWLLGFNRAIGSITRRASWFRDDTPLVLCGYSWGGAVVQLLGEYLARNGPGDVRGALCLGAPRVGSDWWVQWATACPKHCVRNEGDPVPLLPPRLPYNIGILHELMTFTGFHGGPNHFGTTAYLYAEPGPQYVLDEYGEWEYRWQNWAERLILLDFILETPANLMDLGSHWRSWFELHRLDIYKTRLRNELQRHGRPYGLDGLDALNRDLQSDRSYYGTHGVPAGVSGPNMLPIAYATPDQVDEAIEAEELVPEVPEGQTVEQVSLHVEIVSSEGDLPGTGRPVVVEPPPQPIPGLNRSLFANRRVRRNWVFKGKDRRLLEKLLAVALAMDSRDYEIERSASAGTSRLPFIPRAPGALLLAWKRLIERVEYLLSLYVG